MRHRNIVIAGCAFSMMAAGLAGEASAADQTPYEVFNEFSAARFGAAQEELTYHTFGRELAFDSEGDWTYPSHSSATIAFATNLPADAYVEYGPTEAMRDRSDAAERRFYTHIRHLPGLDPGRTYHYRLVAEDERGNVIRSERRTFTTALPEGKRIIRVPDDLPGPPYVLDEPDAYYLVTQDLTVDGTAFDVPADTGNVTLDLGGRKVIYNRREWPTIEGDGGFWDWVRGAKYGVRAVRSSGLKVYNGTIIQGPGANAAQANSIGYNPMYLNACEEAEVAGVTVKYEGDQQVGIYSHFRSARSTFHHNVFLDGGSGLANRHGSGSRSLLIQADRPDVKVHHNLVKRTRQSGLRGSEVFNNEVYIDSWATNSFGIILADGGTAHDNKVFGTGYHVVAFGWGHQQTFRDNFIHLEGTSVKNRFDEYGDQISLNGFRLTQYHGQSHAREDNVYHDNTVIIRGREASQGRGTQFWGDQHVTNLIFRNNAVKAVAADERTQQVAAIVVHGDHRRFEAQEPIAYVDNRLVSNICNVRFGDNYGLGSNTRFINCTFVRADDDPRYRTFIFDHAGPSRHHVVRDPIFEGGADIESITFGSGEQDITFEWTITIATAANATVTISDATGKQVWHGEADADGHASVPLVQHTATRDGKTVYTPHRIQAAVGDRAGTANVTADAARTVDLPLR